MVVAVIVVVVVSRETCGGDGYGSDDGNGCDSETGGKWRRWFVAMCVCVIHFFGILVGKAFCKGDAF